nr:phosphoribosylglycinamide formyltransferase [Natronospira proteinivora]
MVVLLSGRGSTYQALETACGRGRMPAQIAAVVSDRPKAHGLTLAREHGYAAVAVPRRDHPDRESHEQAMAEAIDRYQPDWIILAGYMRILGKAFVERYQGRMLNTHPSLLPAYRGLNTYQRALEAGESLHGCSIHFVTEALDGGPVIAQAEVPVYPGDTAEELEARTRARERMLYPMVIKLAVEGRLSMRDEAVLLDNTPLKAPLKLAWDKETLE